MSVTLESRLPVATQSRTMHGPAMSTVRPRFGEVYQTHKHALYTFVLFRVGHNRDVAEDLVSDIFLKAYKSYDRYNPEYALTTWLYTIARNTLIDHYRAQRQHEDIDALPVVDEQDALYQLLVHNISKTEVLTAIETLPAHEQTLITAQFFDGLSAKEIALKHAMSHDAVRKQISRTVATLREMLLMSVLLVESFVRYIP